MKRCLHTGSCCEGARLCQRLLLLKALSELDTLQSRSRHWQVNTTVVIPVADKQLAAGIPLPTFPGVTFQNSVVTMENEYVLVGLDFQFAPSALLAAMGPKYTDRAPSDHKLLMASA